ncbi:MAG: TlyA family RNA methyltransferase [Clostridia bacterium]|nr:TlyA family RNA methyltransferase [Clostridia bacterium]
MAGNERLDARIVKEGYATGRDKAKELIRSGAIIVDGKTLTKPAAVVSQSAVVVCTADEPRYVGRGGLKLEAALHDLFPLPHSCVAMDVGASTGGFTHCMLQGGVSRVYAIDVGHGQLHPTLVNDPRVVNLEGTDIRDREALSAVIPPRSVDLLAMDVSFISVRTVLPAVFEYLREGARLLVLIKPQFEAGRADVGKNGIVRDRCVHVRVLRELCERFSQFDCALQALSASPITGGAGRNEGNIEYIATLVYGGEQTALPDIRQLVDTTFSKH